MKIVDRQTFLAMPAGTVFAKYRPCIFEHPQIKGDTLLPNDFLYYELFDGWFANNSTTDDYVATLDAIQLGQDSPPMNIDSVERDGLHDDDQLFAIYEAEDVAEIIKRLQAAIELTKNRGTQTPKAQIFTERAPIKATSKFQPIQYYQSTPTDEAGERRMPESLPFESLTLTGDNAPRADDGSAVKRLIGDLEYFGKVVLTLDETAGNWARYYVRRAGPLER
jgi:hypothetical protein